MTQRRLVLVSTKRNLPTLRASPPIEEGLRLITEFLKISNAEKPESDRFFRRTNGSRRRTQSVD